MATIDHNVRVLALRSPAEVAAEAASIGCAAEALSEVAARATYRLLRVERPGAADSAVVERELGALGGIAFAGVSSLSSGDLLLVASLRQLHALAHRLGELASPPLQALASEIAAALQADEAGARGALEVAGRSFPWGQRTYVMGILNVTPDSFSADGLAREESDSAAAALAQARRFAQEGAELLDVGGESTRPGARPIGIAEEVRRVVPAIEAIARELDLPISIDTYRAEVAAAALDAGAHMVNDVWGLRTPDGGWNEPLARLVSERGVPIVIMHNRRAQPSVGALGGHYPDVVYRNLLGEVITGLRERVAFAEAHGIRRERIIVDPGLGFGKSPRQNLELMRRLAEFRSLGLPLLVGASRKSFVGLSLNLPIHERDEATAATTALAVQAGADIVRVHNVLMNVRAARIADAIFRT